MCYKIKELNTDKMYPYIDWSLKRLSWKENICFKCNNVSFVDMYFATFVSVYTKGSLVSILHIPNHIGGVIVRVW